MSSLKHFVKQAKDRAVQDEAPEQGEGAAPPAPLPAAKQSERHAHSGKEGAQIVDRHATAKKGSRKKI